MGLREIVQAAASTAIGAVGNIAIASTYVSVENESAYDPGSDIVQIQGTEYEDIPIIYTDFTDEELQEGDDIQSTDQKVLIAANDLVTSASVKITPVVGDRIHKTATDHWRVQSKNVDPADALWILQIRQVAVRTIETP